MPAEPLDPDVAPPAARGVLPVIAVGGMAGAIARHALEVAWPVAAAGFPWATFVTNVGGSLLLGVLMVHVVEHGRGHPLLRPFLGVGVLGGFTTFSTYAVQSTELVESGALATAALYVLGTVLVAVLGVAAGTGLGRRLLTGRRR